MIEFKGILVPEHVMTERERATPNWEEFRGFGGRHGFRRYVSGGRSMGGAVRFAEHLRKPLSKELWEDVVFRLRPSSLEVYGYDAAVPTIGRSDSVVIHLDKDGFVRDIEYARP